MSAVTTTGPAARGITVQTGNALASVPLASVLYLEARLHYVIVHARCGTFRARTKISIFEAQLAGAGFTRIHRGIVVNDAAVAHQTSHAVDLITGEQLPFGRTRRP